MRYFTILICLCLGTSCLALDLSEQNKIVLKEFLRTLLENSEAGYVLYGKKPVCINGFNLKDRFRLETEAHKISVYLREGARIWKKFNLGKDGSNIIVHVYDNGDSLVKNWVHVLVINRELCINTVNSNLPLFQYVLGPDMTAPGLLEQLIDPKQTFHGVLKNDKVLIGILLGFGTQNALYVSRLEDLEDSCLEVDIPPYKSRVSENVQKNPYLKDIVLLSEYSKEDTKNLKPSFGYATIPQEIAQLHEKIEVSSQKLAQRSPHYIFGRLKDDRETEKLILELEETQNQIAEKLRCPNFLFETLTEILPKEIFSTENEAPLQRSLFCFRKDVNDQLKNIVALSIFENLENENDDYIEAFFRGMKDANQLKPCGKNRPRTIDYQINKILIKAKENVTRCNEKFSQIHQDKKYFCLVPFKLYYRTLQQGSGEKLLEQTNVELHYSIMANDQLLGDTNGLSKEIDLSQTIPGFAHGVKGMCVGEVREIIIHPSLGYRLYTTLEKGVDLKAVVQLVKIMDTPSKQFPELLYDDFLQDIQLDIDEIYKEQTKDVGYFFGYKSWEHYKHGKAYYNLNQIFEIIQNVRNGVVVQIPPSIDIQEVLSQLHWNIYIQTVPKKS